MNDNFCSSSIVFHENVELCFTDKQIGQTMKRIFVDSYSRTVESIKSVCKKKLPESILQASGDIPYVVSIFYDVVPTNSAGLT